MKGLVKRGGVWLYRREVPKRLRSTIGSREVKRTLGTGDLTAAQRRWQTVNAEVDRLFAEAEATVKNPSIAAYRAVEDWRQQTAARPLGAHEEDAINSHVTMLLERNNVDAVQRAALEALLKRHDNGGEDNPPLSILFGRYYAERKLPAKTKLEWDGVLRRFTATTGGDLPVRALTQAHVRNFKAALLATTGRTGGTLSSATVKKTLGALCSVLSWGKREGYLMVNPAEGITAMSSKADPEERRLPYDTDDLKKLLGDEAVKTRKGRPADEWLPFLALYTGARLEELGQLRTADVRKEDGVTYFAIEGGDGKRIKNRSSRRRIPVHPALVRLGFLTFVDNQRAAGHDRLFPELKATSLGSLTAAWSKYWGRHARELGVTDKRKTFHSFRHTFVDAARAVMEEEHRHALTIDALEAARREKGDTIAPADLLAELQSRGEGNQDHPTAGRAAKSAPHRQSLPCRDEEPHEPPLLQHIGQHI